MRIYTLAIAFLIGISAEAQVIRAEPFYVAPEEAVSGNLLLDDYPGAAVAYSLRKLDKNYTGSAIRVRRSSDNTEQDIGFLASGFIDTASMKTFVGAGNGFVVTWYNQADSAGVFGIKNAVNTTAANQPQIVSSGALNYYQSKLCIRVVDNTISAITQHLKVPLWHAASDTSVWLFSVFGLVTGSTYAYPVLIGTDPVDKGFYTYMGGVSSNTPFRLGSFRNNTFYGPASSAAISGNTLYLRTDNANRSTLSLWLNGGTANTASDFNANFNMPTAYWIGNSNANDVRNDLQAAEFVAYPTSQVNNRTAIRDNINSFYSIY